jgi:hypothetical protein
MNKNNDSASDATRGNNKKTNKSGKSGKSKVSENDLNKNQYRVISSGSSDEESSHAKKGRSKRSKTKM